MNNSRPLDDIVADLKTAYSDAHAVNLRFGRAVKRGNVDDALAMAPDLRAAHAGTLRLLDEAIKAVDTETDDLPQLRRQTVSEALWIAERDTNRRKASNDLAILEFFQLVYVVGFVVVMVALARQFFF